MPDLQSSRSHLSIALLSQVEAPGKMRFSHVAVALLPAAGLGAAVELLTDINQISRNWGQISPYADNADDYFGVEYVGLPEGCQIVSLRRRWGLVP